MKKLIRLSIIAFIILIPIAYVSSFNSDNVETFGGNITSGCGCHSDTSTISGSGTINISIATGTEIEAGAAITVSVVISGFTEAADDAVALGFSSSRGDNGDFTFEAASIGAVPVDASGTSAAKDFKVTAPSSEGVYVLTADALNDPDSPTDAEPLDWAYGSLEITVTPAPGADVDVVGLTLLGTIASVGGLVVVSALSIKHNINKKRVIKDI